jgi:predicted metal-dependent hydrolase
MKNIGKVRDIEYTLFRKKNCKNVTVRVMGDGSVRVSAPVSVSVRSVERVIAGNYAKLVATVAVQKERAREYAHTWDDGDRFLFCGNQCRLSLLPGTEDSVDFVDGVIQIRYNGSKPTAEEVQNAVKQMYRGYAKARIDVLVSRWAAAMGIAIPPCSVRDSKRRWGSCSAQGRLSFSLRSAALDDDDLSYLVLHEMAHLCHFDHGVRFRLLLSSYMPDWQDRQAHMFSVQRQSELTL